MATTKEIPIVFRHPADPVPLGLVKSINRPGGNVTGVAAFSLEANQKRLEVLKQIIPNLRRIHIFYDANNRFSPDNFAAAEKSARQLKLDVLEYPVKTASEFKSSLAQMEVTPGDAIFQIADDLGREPRIGAFRGGEKATNGYYVSLRSMGQQGKLGGLRAQLS